MKDYSEHFPDREMITGWVALKGTVMQVQAFYCQNGSELESRWNTIRNGKQAPAPANDHPVYFSPEAGYSMSRDSYHATREAAVIEAESELLRQSTRIQKQLEALRS